MNRRTKMSSPYILKNYSLPKSLPKTNLAKNLDEILNNSKKFNLSDNSFEIKLIDYESSSEDDDTQSDLNSSVESPSYGPSMVSYEASQHTNKSGTGTGARNLVSLRSSKASSKKSSNKDKRRNNKNSTVISSPLSRKIERAFEDLELNSTTCDETYESPKDPTSSITAITPEHVTSKTTKLSRQDETEILKKRLNIQNSYGANYGQVNYSNNESSTFTDARNSNNSQSLSAPPSPSNNGDDSEYDHTASAAGSVSLFTTTESRRNSYSYTGSIRSSQEMIKKQYQEAYLIENLLNSKFEKLNTNSREQISLSPSKNQDNNNLLHEVDKDTSSMNLLSTIPNTATLNRLKFYTQEFNNLKEKINAAPELSQAETNIKKLQDVNQKSKIIQKVTQDDTISNQNLNKALSALKNEENKSLEKIKNIENQANLIRQFNEFLEENYKKLGEVKSRELEGEVENLFGWLVFYGICSSSTFHILLFCIV